MIPKKVQGAKFPTPKIDLMQINIDTENLKVLERDVFAPIFTELEGRLNASTSDKGRLMYACAQTWWTVAYAFCNENFLRGILREMGNDYAYLMLLDILMGRLDSGEAAEFYESSGVGVLNVCREYNELFTACTLPEGELDFTGWENDPMWNVFKNLEVPEGICGEVTYALMFRFIMSFQMAHYQRQLQFECKADIPPYGTYQEFYGASPAVFGNFPMYNILLSIIPSHAWNDAANGELYKRNYQLFVPIGQTNTANIVTVDFSDCIATPMDEEPVKEGSAAAALMGGKTGDFDKGLAEILTDYSEGKLRLGTIASEHRIIIKKIAENYREDDSHEEYMLDLQDDLPDLKYAIDETVKDLAAGKITINDVPEEYSDAVEAFMKKYESWEK